MRARALPLVLLLVLVGCVSTVPGVKSTLKTGDTVKLSGKVQDAAGNPRGTGKVTIKQAGSFLDTLGSGPVVLKADGTFDYLLKGDATHNASNQPFLLDAETSGDHGEWVSQEFYITNVNTTVPPLKLWDDVQVAIDATTGEFQCTWKPPAGAKVKEASLYINQDLVDIWTTTLPDPSNGGTFKLPGAVLDDLKPSNVKVKLKGSPTSYDSANHDFFAGSVAGAKILAIVAATGEDGSDFHRLIDGSKTFFNAREAASPDPTAPSASPSAKTAVVLDLGATQTIAKLAFYFSSSDKPILTITVSDAKDGKGGKTWAGGSDSSVVDLTGAKGRYIRLAGDTATMLNLAEVRAIAP
ncbi:MAG: hypothetical protein JWM80_5003 [Cyanobacteria bacterium RYN_339]|nr:hypothetical protein [Cyanobacteria bacterium RYN_339]